RGILQFLGGGPLPRVGFRYSRAVERYRAYESAIPERWNITAREISRFLSDGLLLRVGFRNSRAVERFRVGKKCLSKAMAFPTRRSIIFLREIFADSCFLVLSVRVREAPAIFLQNRWSLWLFIKYYSVGGKN